MLKSILCWMKIKEVEVGLRGGSIDDRIRWRTGLVHDKFALGLCPAYEFGATTNDTGLPPIEQLLRSSHSIDLIYSHIIVIVLVNRSRRRLGRSVIHNLHDVTT